MTIETQLKLKSNPLYIKYIREHSYWYKILNRDPNMFNEFVNEVKINYHLRPVDKINDVMNTIDVLSNVLGALK